MILNLRDSAEYNEQSILMEKLLLQRARNFEYVQDIGYHNAYFPGVVPKCRSWCKEGKEENRIVGIIPWAE